MMPMKRCSRCLEIWNELDWSACMPPLSRPASCCGKKPLGTMVNRKTFSTMVQIRMARATGPSSSAQSRPFS